MNSDEIRRGLWSIRTRSSTIDAVAGAGASMIDLLLPILQDRNEGVRWSVVKLLGEIGDEPELWRQWLMQDPELRNAESIGILSDEDLVREAVQDLPSDAQRLLPRIHRADVALAEQRSQQVWIDFSGKDLRG
jgi:hypothetical protein